ncbi:MAG: site-specific integrase [Candidatus Bathyarchaeia archaeon]
MNPGSRGEGWRPPWRYYRLLDRLSSRVRERILAVLLAHRHGLAPKTLRNYNDALCHLALKGDLDDVALMERLIPLEKARLNSAIAAYRLYCKFHRLPQPEIRVHIDRRRKLPTIPPEKTLQASIVVPRRFKWQVYFRLLYECGARPSEPFSLTPHVVEPLLEKELVRLGTGKESGDTTERELPISPLLASQLKKLCKEQPNPDGPIFHQTMNPHKPLTYHEAEKVMRDVRKQLKQAGYNVNGLRLHAYRHAFATRLYHATNNLVLVSRALGHRDIKTTMIYIHLQPDQPRRYDVESCGIHDKEAISRFLAEGWELALQTTDTVFFKRPRWVP